MESSELSVSDLQEASLSVVEIEDAGPDESPVVTLIKDNLHDLSIVGSTFAFVDVQLINFSLSDISEIRQFPLLQSISVSQNLLTSLRPLCHLSHLTHLDASDNKLSEVLDFDAPAFLRSVNLSRNQISLIKELDGPQYLQELYLDENRIEEITGLSQLRYLRILSLNGNEIARITGLEELPLRALYLSYNRLEELENLESLLELETLDVRGNMITSIQGLSVNKPLLSCLNVADNRIDDLDELNVLESLVLLRELTLSGNIICERLTDKEYREAVLCHAQQITCLDQQDVSPEEKVDALIHNGYLHDLDPQAPVENASSQVSARSEGDVEELRDWSVGEQRAPYEVATGSTNDRF